ncbi:MAG: hypothetical protein ABI554_14810 [Flavobacterium sp.]
MDETRFESYLISKRIIPEKKLDRTSLAVSELMNAMLVSYTQETRHGFTKDFNDNLGSEKYIALQPEIEVCFVDDLKHKKLTSNEQDGLQTNVANPQKISYFKDYLSLDYYQFSNLTNCKKVKFLTDTVNKERYIPISLDSTFAGEVRAFLVETKGNDHRLRKKFLSRYLKLTPTMFVETLENGERSRICLFSYNFLIDKIIFNNTMTEAEIQFSYYTSSMEASYILEKGKWIKKYVKILTQS